jgi:uncharacterized membrane protein required for colicin V production
VSLIVDIGIIFIAALCTWRGYKDGLIRGAFGFVALIVSLFVANIVAAAYAEEFTSMLRPFVSGIIESTFAEMRGEGVDGQEGEEIEPEEREPFDFGPYENEAEDFKIAYEALRRIGLPEAAAVRVAQLAVEAGDSSSNKDPDATPNTDTTTGADPGATPGPSFGTEMYFAELIAEKLSSILSYVALFAIGFILLAILFTVAGNLVGVVFSLPGLEIIDKIAGGILGLLRGLIIVYVLSAVVRYVGILASSTVDETTVLKYLVNTNPIAVILGI